MGAAFAATMLLGLLALRAVPRSVRSPLVSARPPAAERPPSPGVRARLTAADVTVVRTLPALAFRLDAGQTLDERLPAGPFTGVFHVRLAPGAVRRATFGADLQGGQLIVRVGPRVLLSAYAGAMPARVWPSADVEPTTLARAGVTVTFEFTAVGAGPHGLRGLWRPEFELEPRPLPSSGAPLLDDAALRGRLLAQVHLCAACHRSDDPTLQITLMRHPGPPLGDAGWRVAPAWLARWLRDPAAVKPDARMPRMPAPAGRDDAGGWDDLVHDPGTPGDPDPDPDPDADDGTTVDRAWTATGGALYDEVGCVACHGPLDPTRPGARPWRSSVALGDLASKTTPATLAAFLADPSALHPGTLMPGLGLTPDEAAAIAAALLASGSAAPPPAPARDPNRAARGRRRLAAAGCTACHDVPGAPPGVAAAGALETLAGAADGGCLAPVPAAPAPDFGLRVDERRDLAAFLTRLPDRRSDDVPLDDLVVDLRRLRCTACHAYRSWPGPEHALRPFLGRTLPPDLSGVTGTAPRGCLGETPAWRVPRYTPDVLPRLRAGLAAAAGPKASPPRPGSRSGRSTGTSSRDPRSR